MATKYCSLSTLLPQTWELVSYQGHQGRNDKYYDAASSANATTFSFEVVVEHKQGSLIAYTLSNASRQPQNMHICPVLDLMNNL